MWKYNYTDELYHFGVPGMKWGARRASKKLNKKMQKTFKALDKLNKTEKTHYVKNEYGDSPHVFITYNIKKRDKYLKNVAQTDRYMRKLNKKYGSNWQYNSNYSPDGRADSGKGFVETTVNGHKVRKEWK